MNKYTYITAIVIALILGISFYSVQTSKQESIERQKQMEIEQKKAELDYKKEQAQKLEDEKSLNQDLLNTCISDAETAYLDYAKINGTEKDDGTIWATNFIWDKAQKNKDIAVKICFDKYK